MHTNLVFDKNVYQHINDAEYEVTDLWIIRNSWARWVAKVVNVEPYAGPAPYYGNPKVLIHLHELDGKFIKPEMLRCPGTYGYARVPRPSWSI